MNYCKFLFAFALCFLICACSNSEVSSDTYPSVSRHESVYEQDVPSEVCTESDIIQNPLETLPQAFKVVSKANGNAVTRYDLSENEIGSLWDMINKIEKKELATSQAQGTFLYLIQCALSNGNIVEFEIYEGNIVRQQEADFHVCSGIDYSLLDDICKDIKIYKKSEEEISSAKDAFSNYFYNCSESGATIIDLWYDEALSSNYTDAYIHNSTFEKWLDETCVIVLSFIYRSSDEADFLSIAPEKPALAILVRDNPEAVWEVVLCQ